MKSMEEEDHLISSRFCPETPQDESKARRQRKKEKEIENGDSEISGEVKKRRLSEEQVKFLEMNFGKERKLESCRKVNLATETGLDPKQVAVWFQNRRARWKSKQLEEEYVHLRSSHDAVLIEKCRLENEILNLKDKLGQSEEEIKRLMSARSPISSLSMETHLGEFGIDEGNGMQMSPYIDDFYSVMEMNYLYGM